MRVHMVPSSPYPALLLPPPLAPLPPTAHLLPYDLPTMLMLPGPRLSCIALHTLAGSEMVGQGSLSMSSLPRSTLSKICCSLSP